MLTGLLRASIAVYDLEATIEDYARLGLRPVSEIKESPRGFGLRWVELGDDHGSFLELLAPTTPDGPVARFLEQCGEGLYQIRLGTEDLAATLDTLESRGVGVVRDPRDDLTPLGWIHPSSTHGVLIELVERTREELTT